MKKILTMALVTACSLSLPSTAVQAGDDEAIAAIGGFVVGLITGSIVDKDTHYGHRGHASTYYSPSPYRDNRNTHYSHYRHGAHDSYGHGYRHIEAPEVTGRWETRRVKKWVPGWWDVTYNHCGDRIKVWREGYYRWETERVWVSFCNTTYRHRR